MVDGLESNMRYDFAVRLHMDHMSSPWSSPIYLRTLLEGDLKDFNTFQSVNSFM